MIIYKLTNTVNDMSYIGQTIHPTTRKQQHFGQARRGGTSYLHRSIRKYGKSNFTWEILCECSSKEELDEMEFHYIKQYNTYHKGYNMSWGGELASTGYKHTDECRERMSKYQLLHHPTRGKKLSDSHKQKISEAHKGKVYTSKTYSITTPDGETLKVTNLAKYCRENKIQNSHMTEVAQGKRKSHKGYTCSFT